MPQLPAPGLFTTALQFLRGLIRSIPQVFETFFTLLLELQEWGVIVFEIAVLTFVWLLVAVCEKIAPKIKAFFKWGMKKFE